MTRTPQLPELITTAVAHVYVLDCDHGVKVGITVQTIGDRVADLARAAGLLDIRVVRTWPFETRGAARRIEMGAHWLLRDTRTISEWFHCHPLEACDAVERCIRHGVPLASWLSADDAAAIAYRQAA